MAQALQVTVEPRTVIGKGLSALRRDGYAPANVYGGGAASTPVQIKLKDLEDLLQKVTATTAIDLVISPSGDARRVFLRTVQRGSVSRVPLHAEFFTTHVDHLMRTAIPLVLRGDAPAATNAGITVINPTTHLNVEGRPGDLPSVIEVDISDLTASDQQILAKDLRLPANVTLLDDPSALIVRVQRVRRSAAEEPPAETGAGGSAANPAT